MGVYAVDNVNDEELLDTDEVVVDARAWPPGVLVSDTGVEGAD